MLENRKPVPMDFAAARDQVLTDYRNDAIERKRLVSLEVEHGSQRLRERHSGTIGAESCRIRNRRRMSSATAGAERCRGCDYEGTTHHSVKLAAGYY